MQVLKDSANSDRELRLCIRGAHFSGKSTLLMKLFDNFNVQKKIYQTGCIPSQRKYVIDGIMQDIRFYYKQGESLWIFMDEIDDIRFVEKMEKELILYKTNIVIASNNTAIEKEYKNRFEIFRIHKLGVDEAVKIIAFESGVEDGNWLERCKNGLEEKLGKVGIFIGDIASIITIIKYSKDSGQSVFLYPEQYITQWIEKKEKCLKQRKQTLKSNTVYYIDEKVSMMRTYLFKQPSIDKTIM